MNEDKIIVMGISVGAPGYYPGPNFKEIPCSECGKNCWIGPKQQEVLTRPNSAAICMVCAVKEYGMDIKMVPLVQNSGSSFNREEMEKGPWPELDALKGK